MKITSKYTNKKRGKQRPFYPQIERHRRAFAHVVICAMRVASNLIRLAQQMPKPNFEKGGIMHKGNDEFIVKNTGSFKPILPR